MGRVLARPARSGGVQRRFLHAPFGAITLKRYARGEPGSRLKPRRCEGTGVPAVRVTIPSGQGGGMVPEPEGYPPLMVDGA